jgi:hypothetical protein
MGDILEPTIWLIFNERMIKQCLKGLHTKSQKRVETKNEDNHKS